jgi:hypothetical protein
MSKTSIILMIIIGVVSVAATIAAPFIYSWWFQNNESEARGLYEINREVFLSDMINSWNISRGEYINDYKIYQNIPQTFNSFEQNLIFSIKISQKDNEKFLIRAFLLDPLGRVKGEYPLDAHEHLYDPDVGESDLIKKQDFSIDSSILNKKGFMFGEWKLYIMVFDLKTKKLIADFNIPFNLTKRSAWEDWSAYVGIGVLIIVMALILIFQKLLEKKRFTSIRNRLNERSSDINRILHDFHKNK